MTYLQKYGDRISMTASGLFVIIYLILNIFSIGGVPFIISLNNYLSPLFALGVTGLAVKLWRQLAGSQNRSLWTGFAIGWALWTIAEVWWAVATILGKEVPYPSLADFFWLIGYIPIFFALWLRVRSLPKNNQWTKNVVLAVISVVILGWTFVFVLAPILKNYNSSLLLKSVLDILYPLVDLVTIILAFWIFFAFQKGIYGRTWFWLSIGYVLHSVSDLLFSYATNANLYYPQGNANLISTLGIDVPYTLGYLAFVIGLLIFIDMQSKYQLYGKPERALPIIPNTHITIFLKRDDTVIDTSRNYQHVYPCEAVKGKTAAEIMGISEDEARSICEEIKEKSMLQDRLIEVKTLLGKQAARLCGVSLTPDRIDYEGAIFLVRVMMPDNSLDAALSAHEKDIVHNMMKRTGAKEAEEEEKKQFLSGYYSAYLKILYNQTLVEGGVIMADALAAELHSVSEKHGWRISSHPDFLLDTQHTSLVETQKALSVLLETSKKFAANIIGEHQVAVIIKNVDEWFDIAVHENVNYLAAQIKAS